MAKGMHYSEGVFNDDLHLVDYLNAVLTTEPLMNVGCSPEYLKPQLEAICRPSRGVAKLTLIDTSKKHAKKAAREAVVADEATRAENHQLKIEMSNAVQYADLLENEKKRLAAELDQLKARLASTQADLQLLSKENKGLKSQIEPMRLQISELTKFKLDALEQEAYRTPVVVEVEKIVEVEKLIEVEKLVEVVKVVEVVKYVDPTVVAVLQDVSPEVAVTKAEPEMGVMPLEPQPERVDRAAVSVEERMVFTRSNDEAVQARSDARLDSELNTRVRVEGGQNEPTIKKRPAVFSSSAVVLKSENQNRTIVTKVIKPQESGGNQNPKQPEPVTRMINPQPELILPECIAEISEDLPVTEGLTNSELQCSEQQQKKALDTDEIKLENAPSSKVVTRRNAQNYELLQQEADTENKAPEFKLTLVT